MQALTPLRLLELWEAGRGLHPLDQGVLAAAAAYPDRASDVADWPIGRRNRALAELHAAAFGPALGGWTRCVQCAEPLEFHLDAQALAAGAADGADWITLGDRRYRLPTSRDLAAVFMTQPDPQGAARALLERCRAEGGPAAATLDECEIEAVGERMAEADPLAEILLRFDCPGCGTVFDEPLELAAFLWAELETQARRLLMEVDALARAYGWREADILALSPARRAAYLELARG